MEGVGIREAGVKYRKEESVIRFVIVDSMDSCS